MYAAFIQNRQANVTEKILLTLREMYGVITFPKLIYVTNKLNQICLKFNLPLDKIR